MTLSEHQRLFVKLQAKWLVWVHEQGYELTEGDGFRAPSVFGHFGKRKEGAYGRATSLHKLKLAHDWNLWIDGVYQTTTEAHRHLGEKWESMHPLCRWGGRFNDGNHYSLEYRGYQ